MGKTDAVTKKYMENPVVFADAFNQFLYHGRQRIDPSRLVELDTAKAALPYGADGASVPEQKYRDVLKLLNAMTDGDGAHCCPWSHVIFACKNDVKKFFFKNFLKLL